MKMRRGFQNRTKQRVLEVLECKTWLDVPNHCEKIGIQPVRRAYTYLAHLTDLGLVARSLDTQGKLRYQITDRGPERLQWLRSKEGT
jgi:hypothetical protein